MEIGTQYWTKQQHLIHVKPLDLHSLYYWGGCLKGRWCRTFKRKHDNLLNIIDVELQPALVQYYDLPLRCFTFRNFQIAPTLEEYEHLLGLPWKYTRWRSSKRPSNRWSPNKDP
ncbi:hypothetical protein CR513_25994, partial [Mucuna pruriens]